MRRPSLWILAALLAGAIAAGAHFRVGTALEVGAGFAARVSCALMLNSGFDQDLAMNRYVAHVLGPSSALLRIEVDRTAGSVDARAARLVGARAIHREGVGCTLLAGSDEGRLRGFQDPGHRPALSPSEPWPEGNGPIEPPPARLSVALDAAFAEPEGVPGRMRQTHAVLVVHRGQLLAERYAPGIDASTPLLSWSAAKSVIASLVGVASLEGRIDLLAPAPVTEWQAPDDPRRAITTDQLLRMSSGLAFDETYGATQDVSRMLFTRADTGAFAASFLLQHPPDSAWSYSSGTSNILARILRQRFDGDLQAMVRWSRDSFFDPLGMRSAFFGTDASGSFIGSSFFFATARDYARFGQLHLQDGVWQGRRILPEGWVDYVRTPTPASRGGYGAGWWLNDGDPDDPEERMWPSLPRETFAARGMSGQYVVVVPSADLVVVRLGLTQSGGDALQGIEPLVAAVLEAVAGGPIEGH